VPEAAGSVERIAIPQKSLKLAYNIHLSDTNVWKLDLGQKPGSVPKETRLIAGTYDDEEAQLSPDGRMIAFASARSGEEQAWIAGADGSRPRKISSFDSADAVSAIWTRDSKNLVVSVRSKKLGLRFYVTPATGPVALTEWMRDGFATSVSRDGSWVYFYSVRSGQFEIWKTNLPGPRRVEQVTSTGAFYAMESVDGTSLYFSKRDEEKGIWKQPFGGRVRRAGGRSRLSKVSIRAGEIRPLLRCAGARRHAAGAVLEAIQGWPDYTAAYFRE